MIEAASLWGDADLPSVQQTGVKPTRYNALKAVKLKENPCVALYGSGPEGALCKGCHHLRNVDYHGKVYHKCELRKATHGRATDHRPRWPVCARYEPDPAGERPIEFIR